MPRSKPIEIILFTIGVKKNVKITKSLKTMSLS